MSDEGKIVLNECKKNYFHGSLKSLIATLLLLISFLFLLLNSPTLQNKLVNSLTNYIQNKTGFEVQMSGFHINMQKGLEFEDFLLRDQNKDTLVYAAGFSTSIIKNIIPMIIKKNYNFSSIGMDQAVLKINKNEGDTLSNIELFFKRLNFSQSSQPGNCTDISLHRIELNNSKFYIDNIDIPQKLLILIPKGKIVFKKLDLCKEVIKVKRLELHSPSVEIDKNENYVDSGKENKFNFDFLTEIKTLNIFDGALVTKNNSTNYNSDNSKIDFKNLDISNINIDLENTYFDGENELTSHLKSLTLKERGGFEINDFTVDSIIVSKKLIGLLGLDISSKLSEIVGDLKLNFDDFSDFKRFKDKVLMDINLDDSDVDIREFKYFVENISQKVKIEELSNTNFHISGRVQGYIDDFHSENLNLNLENNIILTSDFGIKNISEGKNALFNINSIILNAKEHSLDKFIPNSALAEKVVRLGDLNFDGSFSGKLSDFTTKGTLVSRIGLANMDIAMHELERTSVYEYSGFLRLEDFETGQFFNDANMGVLSGQFNVIKGRNFKIDNLNAQFKSKIDSFIYKGYTYRNIIMDGVSDSRAFEGNMSMKDANFDMKLNGKIDLRDSIPVFNFKASVKGADLYALKLYDKKLFIDTEVNMNIFGANPENFTGKLNFNNINISNGIQSARIDSLSIYSKVNESGERYLDGISDFMSFYFDGKYKIKNLAPAFYKMMDDHFSKFLTGINKKENINADFSDYHYDFNFRIYDSGNIFDIILGKKLKAVNLSLDGSAFHDVDSVKFNLTSDSLLYESLSVGNLTSGFNLYQGFGDFQLKTDKIGLNKFQFNGVSLSSDIDKNQMYFNTNIDSVSNSSNSLSLSGKTTPFKDSFEIQVYGGFITAYDSTFQFSGDNRIVLAKKLYKFI
ncbi:MAG: hypothetical protein R2771_15145 [Saprospiraceae bacterium]